MRNALAVALLACRCSDAWAQGVPNQPQPQTTVAMRYYFNANAEPTSLKLAMEKVPGVTKVAFETKTKYALVTWGGRCADLQKLEEAARKSGTEALVISHVPLVLAMKPGSGAKVEIIKEELGLIKGTEVPCLQCAGAAATVHADLRTVTFDALKAAGRNADFQFQLKPPSPAWVEVAIVEGDVYKASNEVERLKGVLVITPDAKGKKITLWVRDVKDEAIKGAVEKSGVKLEKITRP